MDLIETVNAFKSIETDLLDGIMKNLYSIPEVDANQWRIFQLRRLEQFRLDNLKYEADFSKLNAVVEDYLSTTYKMGATREEKRIMRAVRQGYLAGQTKSKKIAPLNEERLKTFIEGTMKDFGSAEQALLRKAADEYKTIIYKGQLAIESGTMTYKQAVDSATKDFLSRGLQCVQYKNGSCHSISDYVDMAMRTGQTRAILYGEGKAREAAGQHLVLISSTTGTPCACCLPYIGKVLIDDVYSGGTAEDGDYELLSTAMAESKIFHPRCRCTLTTYIPEYTEKPEPLSEEDKAKIIRDEEAAAEQSYIDRTAEKYGRLAKYSADKENKKENTSRKKAWKNK